MKFDRVQVMATILLILLIIIMFAVPYRSSSLTEQPVYGYKSFFNWVIVIYSIRIYLHLFGFEIYNMVGNIYGLLGVFVAGFILKAFFFKSENTIILWGGIGLEFLMLILFIGILFLDRMIYETGNKKNLSSYN